MDFTEEEIAQARRLARDELWRRGDLTWKLDPNQLDIYQRIFGSQSLQFVIEAARKLGKSYLLCLIATETALKNPGRRINYGAPTGKEAHEIVLPVMQELTSDAPPDCKPVWAAAKGHWEFPNGAFIVLFGCDDEQKADRGRGPEAVLNILDEAGFISVLSYALDSVLAPQTIQTRGRTILGSTPPKSPSHDFCSIADAAHQIGAYVNRDIYSHGRLSRDQIDEYLTQRALSRGMTLEQFRETTDYQREYGARRVLDATLAVVPEFARVRDRICVASPRPEFFNWYVAIDPGMSDKTGVLFGFYDFRAAKLVIEHELLLTQAHTQVIAEAIRQVEQDHYRDLPRAPARVVDDPHGRLVADLWHEHRLQAGPADTKDREAADNLLRLWVSRERILINPRCVQLIHQLATGIRDKKGDLKRSREGHLDLIAALRHLLRALDESANPFPPDWNFDPTRQTRRHAPRQQMTLQDVLRNRRR